MYNYLGKKLFGTSGSKGNVSPNQEVGGVPQGPVQETCPV